MTELLDAHGEEWAARLRELVETLDVPGAVLGVSHRGERIIAAAGVRGLRDGAPVTVDTAFQIGSISKLYTATLVMMLGGSRILERSVAELVPEAVWMAPEIRVGHLLTHSSGLGGDWFSDTGRGDDCLARYVEQLAGHPPDVPLAPGTRYSYCNSGFAVLGRLIEVLAGQAGGVAVTYDDVLRERLLAPLRATATSTLPEQAILRPVATGHNRPDDGPLAADDAWNFARACGPLGGICASAGDVLSFAELHLADGVAPGGERLLEAATARLMRARRVLTPRLSRPAARGLGFGVFDWPGAELAGHDGETLGQVATLRLDVEHDLALVVLANAIPDGDEVTRAMTETVLATLGHTPPRLPRARDDPAFDPTPYEGRYRNLMGDAEVRGTPGGLEVAMRYRTEGLPEATAVTRLRPIGDGAFVDAARSEPARALVFGDPDPRGRRRSFFNGRIMWREDDCPNGE